MRRPARLGLRWGIAIAVFGIAPVALTECSSPDPSVNYPPTTQSSGTPPSQDSGATPPPSADAAPTPPPADAGPPDVTIGDGAATDAPDDAG